MRKIAFLSNLSSLCSAALLCTGLALGSSPSLAAASAPPKTEAGSQAMIDALSRANAGVVGLQVTAADGARSIQTLGKQRTGSGVVINAEGLILTIGYLMLEAENISITTADNKTMPARAVAYDLATGFGLIKPLLPMRGAQAVALGSSEGMKAGDTLMASVGAQGNADGDVHMTQLVSKRPFSGYWEYHIDTALFTSPPIGINGGNHSGAPLFNSKGELLGIGSLFVMDAMGRNVRLPGNMFVPVDLLKPILAELQEKGMSAQSRRPWLGLTSSEQEGRVQIVRVNQDSPAANAGLKPGDVVLAVDNANVATLEAFYKKLWDRASPVADVSLTVLQGAELKTIVLKPVDRMGTMLRPAGI